MKQISAFKLRRSESVETSLASPAAFTIKRVTGGISADDTPRSRISKVTQLHEARERKLLRRIKPIAQLINQLEWHSPQEIQTISDLLKEYPFLAQSVSQLSMH